MVFCNQNNISFKDDLISGLHRDGINIRHLGVIRSLVSDEILRGKLMVEMLARLFRKRIAKMMRAKATGWLSGIHMIC